MDKILDSLGRKMILKGGLKGILGRTTLSTTGNSEFWDPPSILVVISRLCNNQDHAENSVKHRPGDVHPGWKQKGKGSHRVEGS